jgi:hypothetical protein
MQNQQRYAYKLTRGIIARREGFDQKHVDPETGETAKLRTRPYVHYQSRSAENPLARDEIMLTEAEAAAHNKHGRRVVRLLSGEAAAADKGKPESLTLEGLMNMLSNARGGPSVGVVRQVIFDSGLVPTEKLPFKKAELMAVLQNAIEKRNDGHSFQIVEAERPE